MPPVCLRQQHAFAISSGFKDAHHYLNNVTCFLAAADVFAACIQGVDVFFHEPVIGFGRGFFGIVVFGIDKFQGFPLSVRSVGEIVRMR